jgi:hypothetical protein
MRLAGVSLLVLLLLAGCRRSHVIEVTVTNTSPEKISNIVIDYPEATFGINLLAPGKSFHYKIKPTGTGAIKIEFINGNGHDRMSAGPVVHKGDEGTLEIRIEQERAVGELRLSSH